MTQYLMPLINEFTLDIYPENPMQAITQKIADSFPRPHSDINYSELLHSRRRTLPTNGLSVNIKNCFYKKILFKEIYKFDQVVLLYKITTEYGELSGSYQTVSESFYSVFETIPQAEAVAMGVKEFVLWLYTAYVCDCEGITLSSDSFRAFLSDPTVELEFTQIGGKLRPAQNSKIKRLPIAGKDGYESEIKHINGYVRKLPVGQKPSDKAIQLARSLGYSLQPDETFVAPFQRTAWLKLR